MFLGRQNGVIRPNVVSFLLFFNRVIWLRQGLSLLDYKIYEEVVKATHEQKSIFYDGE